MTLGSTRAADSKYVSLFWGLACAVVVLACFASQAFCQAKSQPPPVPLQDERRLLHLLNRLSYAPLPGQLAAIAAQGETAYLDAQLNPSVLPENPLLTKNLAAFPALSMDPVQLFVAYGPKRSAGGRDINVEELQKTRAAGENIARQTAVARMWRAALSSRQLQELMTAFWLELMPLTPGKGPVSLWTGHYEELLRTHALGSFPELLNAVCRHPAMLVSADAYRQTQAETAGPKGKLLPVDETFARTVLFQLSMGPKVKPAAADIQALAKALTGYSFGASRGASEGDGFFFDPARQIKEPLVFLGQPIEVTGEQRGVAALNLVARHPATADYLCRKLAQYFLDQEPSKALFEAMAAAYAQHDGRIDAVLRVLFSSDDFFSEREWQAKLRNHARYAAFIARASGTGPAAVEPLVDWLASVGVMIDQPGDWGRAGATEILSGGLMPRLKLAADVGSAPDKIFGSAKDVTQEFTRSASGLLRPATGESAEALPGAQRLTLMLGAPESQRY